MEGGIERPLLNAEHVARYLLNALGYAPAVLRPEGEGAEDQQIQSALRQVDVWNRHLLFPSCFYKSIRQVLSKGKGRVEGGRVIERRGDISVVAVRTKPLARRTQLRGCAGR